MLLLQVLPDLKEPRWAYNGTAMMHNQEAHVWVMHSKEELGYGDVISTYTMYVGKVRKEPRMANAHILLLVLLLPAWL